MNHTVSAAQRTPSRRVALAVAAILLALLFTAAAVLAQAPDFSDSYKAGPPFADAGDTITYTIVVINSGDAATDVVLSDTMPSGVTLQSCAVYTEGGSAPIDPCDPAQLWVRDVAAGERITTTIVVEVTPGTLVLPLVNRAHIGWNAGIEDTDPVTTTVNPLRIFLPIIMNNSQRSPGIP